MSHQSETLSNEGGHLSGRELDAAIAGRVFGRYAEAPDYARSWWLENTGPNENRELPAYSTDLNACFEAQARVIEKVGATAYIWHLTYSAAPDGVSLATATAEQRCRAMLLALEGK